MYYGSTGLENLTMNQLRERIASVSLELKDLELDPHKNSLKIAQVKIRKSNLVAEMMKRQGAVVVQGQATSKGKASNGSVQSAEPQGLSMDEINTLKTTADEFKNISSITNAEIEQSLNLVIEPLGAMFNGYWTKLPLTDKLYIQSAIINGFIAMQTKLNRPIAMPASFPKEVIDVYISLPPFQPQEASEQPIQMVKTQTQPSASTAEPIAQDKPALLPFEPAGAQYNTFPVKIPIVSQPSQPKPTTINQLSNYITRQFDFTGLDDNYFKAADRLVFWSGLAYISYRLYNRQK